MTEHAVQPGPEKRCDLEIVQQSVGHGGGDTSRCTGMVGVGSRWRKRVRTRENLMIRCASSLQTCLDNYAMLNRAERMKKMKI